MQILSNGNGQDRRESVKSPWAAQRRPWSEGDTWAKEATAPPQGTPGDVWRHFRLTHREKVLQEARDAAQHPAIIHPNPTLPLASLIQALGFPGGSVVKNPSANAVDTGSVPDLGKSHMPQSN